MICTIEWFLAIKFAYFLLNDDNNWLLSISWGKQKLNRSILCNSRIIEENSFCRAGNYFFFLFSHYEFDCIEFYSLDYFLIKNKVRQKFWYFFLIKRSVWEKLCFICVFKKLSRLLHHPVFESFKKFNKILGEFKVNLKWILRHSIKKSLNLKKLKKKFLHVNFIC